MTTSTVEPVVEPKLGSRPRDYWQLVAPVIVAIIASGVVLLISGRDPIEFYRLLGREAFGSWGRIAATLASATPLLFSGTATAIAFRAGYFNIGVEASFIAGAFSTAVLGTQLALPTPLTALVLIVAAATTGGLIGAGPGYLKAYRGVDEVVVTLMGNFVVVGCLAWLLHSYFLSTGTGNASSDVINQQAKLAPLVDGSQLTVAFVLALILLGTLFWWLKYHRRGYELRMTGSNPAFADTIGIDTRRVVLSAATLSGAIGGIGGWALTAGVLERYVDGAGQNLGFTGIAVAILGRGRPIGIVIAAIGLGALAAAGPTIQLFSDIPLDIVRIIQGVIIIAAVLNIGRRRTA